MQYDPTDRLLTTAFDVIRRYDPDLYARMAQDDWTASTDAELAFNDDPQTNYPGFWWAAVSSFGVTLSESDRYGRTPEVWVNHEAVRNWAHTNDVPAELFAADVLAHEYRHIHQPSELDGAGNEPPAFRAGSAFAAKLPAPYGARIKALSDETLAQMGSSW